MQNKNRDRVQNAVRGRTRQHGEHGELRAAVRADDGVDRLSEDIDGNADGDAGEIFLRIAEIRLRRAEQRQKRHLEHGIEHRGCDAHQHAQRHGAADGAVCVLRLIPAEADRHIAARAVADHDGKTESQNGQREHDVRCAVAEVADAPADKNLVDNVVKRPDQQRDGAWQGKFQHQPAERGCAERGVLFFFHFVFLQT